jgi:hypothetical protein
MPGAEFRTLGAFLAPPGPGRPWGWAAGVLNQLPRSNIGYGCRPGTSSAAGPGRNCPHRPINTSHTPGLHASGPPFGTSSGAGSACSCSQAVWVKKGVPGRYLGAAGAAPDQGSGPKLGHIGPATGAGPGAGIGALRAPQCGRAGNTAPYMLDSGEKGPEIELGPARRAYLDS